MPKELVQFEKQQLKIHEKKYMPSVIEPSFGIGRIIYCIFEHCYKCRPNDVNWTYFQFPPQVAPVKCFVLPLTNSGDFIPIIEEVRKFYSLISRQGDQEGRINIKS